MIFIMLAKRGAATGEKTKDERRRRLDPEPWDEKELAWRDRLFVKDRVRSLFRIPLSFGAEMAVIS